MDAMSQRQQWLGILLPPTVWATYFVVVYLLNEWICSLMLLRIPGVEETAVLGTAVLLCALTLGVCVYAGRAALASWRQAENAEADAPETERMRFMGASGLLMSLMFGLLTVGIGVATVVLPLC